MIVCLSVCLFVCFVSLCFLFVCLFFVVLCVEASMKYVILDRLIVAEN